jgi:hypothetical protein
VTDFEKVCLDPKADMQLAEVGACHQILALVLGEPAEIDQASRERMYQLVRIAAQAAAGSSPAKVPTPSDDGATAAQRLDHKPRPKPTVPEYLREPRRRSRLLPIAALLVLAGCFVALVLLATRQFEPEKPLGAWVHRLLGGGEAAAPSETASQQAAAPASATVAGQEKSPSEKPSLTPLPTAVEKTPEPSPEPAKTKEVPSKPASEEPPKPPAVLPPDALAKSEPKPLPGPEIKPPAKPEPEAKLPPDPEPKPGEGPNPKKATPEPVAAQRVGKLLSEGLEVLLKYDPETSAWQRVAGDDIVMSGQQLLALPSFRPRIALTSGATLELAGGTRLELLPRTDQEPSGLAVVYGRVVLKPLAQPGVRLRLAAGSQAGVLTLSDAESSAALQVTRTHVPGTSPDNPPHIAAELYVARGEVVWDQRRATPLTGPVRMPLGGVPMTISEKELPKWLVPETIGPIEHGAKVTLSQSLPGNRSPVLSLMELADHRRTEVRGLAVKCLGHVHQFEPVAAALNDLGRKGEWTECIEQLRLGVAGGVETAALVRQAMERQYPQDAGAMYRMLMGYTDQDLQNGEDVALVKGLDHKALGYRVLAFWNLRDITGLRLFYYPENTAARRQQSVARWQQRLTDGKIRLRTPAEKSEPITEPGTPGDKEKAEPPRGVVPAEPPEGVPAEPPEVVPAEPAPPARPVVPEPEAAAPAPDAGGPAARVVPPEP